MIKICGITNLQDAQLAAEAGADAVGFVFAADSPRRMTVASVAAITAALPASLLKVGVFVNADPADMLAAVQAAGLDVLQLHGEEPADLARHLAPAKLWKALHLFQPGYLEVAAEWRAHVVALLLDAGSAHARGGTGRTFDWSQAAALHGTARLIVAGGLTPDNVADCILRTGAWGVDVSSGVEAAPGRKDPHKLRAFIQSARSIPRRERTE